MLASALLKHNPFSDFHVTAFAALTIKETLVFDVSHKELTDVHWTTRQADWLHPKSYSIVRAEGPDQRAGA
ncbi:hypothetical protein [Pseudomonas halotolerans]|uniref:hypothetical protein n=1 Tax=Pseudomonas halotolerans TaxID=3143552 RepID=UPI0031DFB5E2